MDKPTRPIPNLPPPITLPRRRALAAAVAATLALSLAAAIPWSAQAAPFPAVLPLSDLDGSNGFRLDGALANDQSGISVSAAGDVNGDGIDDLIVGASGADLNGSASGSSYVVFGHAGAFAATLNLSSLNGSTGFRLDGAAALDFSGRSVRTAGDANGDGIGDLIVSAHGADANANYSGSSHVVFGHSGIFAPTLNLSSLDGSTGFRLDGVTAGDRSGYSVSAAGDVNGDGFGDLVIGADNADPNGTASGSSYVVFGHAGSFFATLNLSSLNGSTGFRLDGAATLDFSGYSVRAAGDMNGDGIDDLVIGAPFADPNGSASGACYLVFGHTGSFAPTINLGSLDGSTGFRLDGLLPDDLFGISVSAAGDMNGDGFGDLVIGADNADPNGSNSGSSYVVFGHGGVFAPTVSLSTLNGSSGFRLDGVAANDLSGGSVSAAGDVNGDGFGDLVIAAELADPNGTASGSSYLVFGHSGAFAVALNLSSLDGSSGFRLDGVAANDHSGRSVSAAGDINGDGIADLIVGASSADPNGTSGAGSSYVVFGRLADPVVIFRNGFE